ncbi:helix-turn-helix domain-containing protein [Fuchsiella alkaliacetigena]|uniref:helix-turn-helix domain-containing protein n=1 Tax=Fuchsiella alkaliacetigena TaxID=957042 RepID=UPI00200A0887|nr:helix-turn-helix transcriptional regulator [Fuchsiella alkaliacetigena]MCK8824154.1 helix-turn-helix transcriptional regulator [Fuchsiella alkaliacetigena]
MDPKNRVKYLRKSNNLTRKELAKIINYSEDYIYKVETGRRDISKGFLDAISKAFGVPRSYFFKADEYKYNQNNDKIEFEDFIREHKVQFYGQELNEQEKENIIELVKVALKLQKKNS